MRTRFFYLILLVTSLLCTVAQADVNIQQWQTHNHVPVYFVAKKEIPIVDVALIFPAGSARDGKQWGVASLTASLLDEGGTNTKDASAIAQAFDAVGAVFSASASRDIAVVKLRSMRDKNYLNPALTLYLELLSQAKFDTTAFVRVRQQILDGIKNNAQIPYQVANKQLFQQIYGNQPYGHPVVGTPETLNALTQSDVVNFYKQFYIAENAKIVIVGDLDKASAQALADKISQHLASGTRAKALAMANVTKADKLTRIKMPVPQSAIFIGELGVSYNDPDYFNLSVANHILGGYSFNSVLMKTVRDEYGYTYGAYSTFMPLQARGLFAITLETRSEKTNLAQALVLRLLKDYWQQGPTQQQLEDAKDYLLGSFPVKTASNSAILSQVISIAAFGLPLDYLAQYPRHIKAVTVASAKKAFAKAVDLSQLDTVIVGSQ